MHHKILVTHFRALVLIINLKLSQVSPGIWIYSGFTHFHANKRIAHYKPQIFIIYKFQGILTLHSFTTHLWVFRLVMKNSYKTEGCTLNLSQIKP